MKTVFRIGTAIALSVGLSGCITVKCPDGSIALDENGQEVKVNTLSEEDSAAERYCPKAYQPLIDTTPPVNNPPPGPAPTNLAPVAGLAVFGAALLGGGGNNGTPSNSTNGTK
jgi:hypothetical protein